MWFVRLSSAVSVSILFIIGLQVRLHTIVMLPPYDGSNSYPGSHLQSAGNRQLRGSNGGSNAYPIASGLRDAAARCCEQLVEPPHISRCLCNGHPTHVRVRTSAELIGCTVVAIGANRLSARACRAQHAAQRVCSFDLSPTRSC